MGLTILKVMCPQCLYVNKVFSGNGSTSKSITCVGCGFEMKQKTIL